MTGYGYEYWSDQGRFQFKKLTPGKKYKIYASNVSESPLLVSNQWVGGKDFASAKTFVAGRLQAALVLQGVARVLKSTGAPKLSGAQRVGSALSVSKGSWSSGPSAYTYQWLRDGRVIKGATKSSYVLAAVDEGHRIRAKVTGTRSGYASGTAQTSVTGKIGVGRLTVKKKPTVSGTQLPGRKLTVSKGSWSTSPSSFAYRWYRNGKAIKAATKSTYKLTTADRGKKISVTVWAKKAGYATKSAKSGSKYIYKSGLKIGAVSVKGTRKVGKTVKAAVAKPSGVTVKYQWYRNGSAIKGATKASYKLREDDWLEKVSVRVTYSRAGLPTVGKRSAKVYIPDNPYAYDEDDYYSDEDDYSGGSSGYNGPRCYAPGGQTWTPC
ncbi:hypothetical protein [Galactobacter valiniphilus]|uniref:hypothetical protein n=1 Tax=Galactobacter valiniphilus TaxID=2676122 RepID=UPI003735D17A